MIAGILLAAGTSARMGATKQLLPWRGEPLVRHVARQALASSLEGLTVVLGHEAAAVEAALSGLPVRSVRNASYAAGQASSLQTGLQALPQQATATLVLLCDQPLISPTLIDAIIASYREAPEVVAVIPRHNGQRGNPVLLARPLFAELMTLTGDEGARRVLQRYSQQVRWLDVDDAAAVTDVDTLEEYEALSASADGPDASTDGVDASADKAD